MLGILKSNHQKLCGFLEDIKLTQPVPDQKLNEMEKELQSVFLSYQEKMKELKRLIHKYEESERSIRNEIRKVRKYNSVELKKSKKNLMNNTEALTGILVQKSVSIDK